MPNDITTLAIEIQSQEAERNLRTFNELLSLSSQTAKKMEKVSIEIDVQGALAQLNALKAGYRALAASAKNLTFDIGGAFSPPTIDGGALKSLKELFSAKNVKIDVEADLAQTAPAQKVGGRNSAGSSSGLSL